MTELEGDKMLGKHQICWYQSKVIFISPTVHHLYLVGGGQRDSQPARPQTATGFIYILLPLLDWIVIDRCED